MKTRIDSLNKNLTLLCATVLMTLLTFNTANAQIRPSSYKSTYICSAFIDLSVWKKADEILLKKGGYISATKYPASSFTNNAAEVNHVNDKPQKSPFIFVGQTFLIVLKTVVLFFAALATGGLMVNWIGLTRAMAHMSSASAYTEFHKATNLTFDPYMPAVIIGAILGSISLILTNPLGLHSSVTMLLIGGAICYIGVIAITLPTNLRLNKVISTWSINTPPADWTEVRASWIHFHIIRTLFSVPALFCYILSVLVTC